MPLSTSSLSLSSDFESKRPAPSDRKFSSEAVETVIKKMTSVIKDEEVAWMFENCYPNTLDTTVDFEYIDGKPDAFVITGDIDAMWLRDSTAQVWPYLPLMNEDEELKELVKGLINRQMKCILLDPYANAFYKDVSRESHWKEDSAQMLPGVHERKWEIDSLCYPIRLSNEYYQITGDASIFDDQWDEAMRLAVKTLRTEQRIDGTTPYRFGRRTAVMIDSPPFNGTGRPVNPVGLICSAFRPSDDSTLFPFLIPSNMFAVVSLNQLHDIYMKEIDDHVFAHECHSFAKQVDAAIKEYAIQEHLSFGTMFAYEVDGFGNKIFMDDANVPSLMSLPYIGAVEADDELYLNTRDFLLSDHNPYFLKGEAATGQASPHTGKESIWPMGIILRAITSKDTAEIRKCITMLKNTHADTGFMHESFHKDDAAKYTRDWFAWANTLFGEMIIKVHTEHPDLLKQKF
ncbi:MAG: glycoside hydrolase family 125 protein [Balneolaceae bacterium]|nr:glycoside hydrolase family 125 protein [Balneolaceae bacterium]